MHHERKVASDCTHAAHVQQDGLSQNKSADTCQQKGRKEQRLIKGCAILLIASGFPVQIMPAYCAQNAP